MNTEQENKKVYRMQRKSKRSPNKANFDSNYFGSKVKLGRHRDRFLKAKVKENRRQMDIQN